MNARAVWHLVMVAVATALWTATACAERPWRITAGVDAGARRERLQIDIAGAHYAQDRTLATTRFDLGFRFPWHAGGGWLLSSQSQLGVGWVFETGHPNLALHQSALLEHPLGYGISLPIGLAAGLVIDSSSTQRSALELAIPLGVRFRAVELLWQPGLAVALGHERKAVYAGQKRLGTTPGLVGLAFVARLLF